MAEQTRRVQLTLPECERLGKLLFDEVREDLGIPAIIDDKTLEISRGKWVDALPKIQRAIKMTGTPARRHTRSTADKREREAQREA